MAELPNDSSLPFRTRQSTFRIYEPFIAEAVRLFPEPIAINPSPLRATTFAARLRDAVWSYHHYNWPSTVVDRELFERLYLEKSLVVAHTETGVAIGPRTKRGGLTPGNVSSATVQAASGHRFEPGKWTDDDIRATARLLSSKLISGPVFVRPAISQELLDSLEQNFDVAVTSDEDKTVIL